MTRFIGIRHRIKKTAAGEARPTQVVIIDDKRTRRFDLPTVQGEMDFAFGFFPTATRKVEDGEDLSGFKPHHIVWHKLKSHAEATGLHPSQVKTEGRTFYRAERVPSAYDGLRGGDKVAMILGGSGGPFAHSLAKRGEIITASVHRIPPFRFKELREPAADKDADAQLLADLIKVSTEPFYKIGGRDLALIRVREQFREWMDAMKARIACEQRLRSHLETELLTSGLYPEGAIEQEFDSRKANNPILTNLKEEEARRESEMVRALEKLDIYLKLMKPVRGLGPKASARLLAAIIDPRRFMVEPNREKMQALYEESERLEQEARVEEEIRRLRDKIPEDANRYKVLQIVLKEYARLGLKTDAAKVAQSLKCHHERAVLRHAATQMSANKLKKFCGVHVLPDGRLPRRRHGEVANWHPDARQGLWLLGTEQFGGYQSKTSEWGAYFTQMKIHFREVHPVVEEHEGKKRYTDGHLFNMANWRTLSRFVQQFTKAYIEFDASGKGDGIHPPNRADRDPALEVA